MLVDIHTSLMGYPDHDSEAFLAASREAKQAKMRITAEVHRAIADAGWKHTLEGRPESLLEPANTCDNDPGDPQGFPTDLPRERPS